VSILRLLKDSQSSDNKQDRREEYKEEDAIFAPLYHRYGHALLEHAIATSGALGGGGGSKDAFELEPNAVASTVASARAKEPVADSSKSAEGM
jgi:hypothetical protein